MADLGPRELERVLVDALDPTADAELIEREDWVGLSTPSSSAPNRNGIYLARLSPEEADARIDAVKRAYAERGASFRWVVGPSSTPGDLGTRLAAAGMSVLATAWGMTLAVPSTAPELPEGLEFQAVGPAELDLYGRVGAETWARGEWFRRESEAVMARALARGDGKLRSWIVREHGEPVATSTLCLLPRLGYLQGGAVRLDRRRHGIYRALVNHRLGILRSLGIDDAVVWAVRDSSGLACEQLGFVPVCEAVWYELQATQPSG